MTTKRETKEQVADTIPPDNTIRSIKGFNADLTCLGYKFEIGRTYKTNGPISTCKKGFHACPIDVHPFSVFEFYPPTSRFALVTQRGETDRSETKVASAKITIDVELSIGDLVKRAVDWTYAQAVWTEGAASATGYQGAASATGDQGAASATGDRGAASATGDRGAASATGKNGKVKGAFGNALFAVERDICLNIVSVSCGIVGQGEIKPDVWYMCKSGVLVATE